MSGREPRRRLSIRDNIRRRLSSRATKRRPGLRSEDLAGPGATAAGESNEGPILAYCQVYSRSPQRYGRGVRGCDTADTSSQLQRPGDSVGSANLSVATPAESLRVAVADSTHHQKQDCSLTSEGERPNPLPGPEVACASASPMRSDMATWHHTPTPDASGACDVGQTAATQEGQRSTRKPSGSDSPRCVMAEAKSLVESIMAPSPRTERRLSVSELTAFFDSSCLDTGNSLDTPAESHSAAVLVDDDLAVGAEVELPDSVPLVDSSKRPVCQPAVPPPPSPPAFAVGASRPSPAFSTPKEHAALPPLLKNATSTAWTPSIRERQVQIGYLDRSQEDVGGISPPPVVARRFGP